MITADEPIVNRGLDVKLEEESWGFKGKNYLFLIGIDKYHHWPPLKCAVKDVQDFAEIVTSRYQFEKSDILFLKDDEATEKKILSGFTHFAKKITNEDNLIIYYSGHGHFMTNTGYWIPVNAHMGDESEDEFINTAVVVDKLRTINSLHTFLIIDACFSGTLITQIKSSPRSERYKSRRVLTSGRAEVVRDGPEGGNSPFARGILNELANNTNPFISASQVIAEVRAYVERESQQTPTDARLVNADDQGGDFVFHLRLSEAEIWANVVQQHSKEVYKRFAEQFPNSTHKKEAEEAHEWLAASQQNTIKALAEYLEKYQGTGKYIAPAIKALESLEDEDCWRRANSKNTLSGYFEYINRFPNGKYAEQARVEIKRLPKDEDDKAFEKVVEAGSPDAFVRYIDSPGEKKYVDQAERKLHPDDPITSGLPDEEKAWEAAKRQNTFISYHDFVLAFPDSEHLEEGKSKMAYLDNVAFNAIKIMEQSSTMAVKDQIDKCINYFKQFPGAPNNFRVKQIKDRLEINRLRGL
jgi:hypothetical protein